MTKDVFERLNEAYNHRSVSDAQTLDGDVDTFVKRLGRWIASHGPAQIKAWWASDNFIRRFTKWLRCTVCPAAWELIKEGVRSASIGAVGAAGSALLGWFTSNRGTINLGASTTTPASAFASSTGPYKADPFGSPSSVGTAHRTPTYAGQVTTPITPFGS